MIDYIKGIKEEIEQIDEEIRVLNEKIDEKKEELEKINKKKVVKEFIRDLILEKLKI